MSVTGKDISDFITERIDSIVVSKETIGDMKEDLRKNLNSIAHTDSQYRLLDETLKTNNIHLYIDDGDLSSIEESFYRCKRLCINISNDLYKPLLVDIVFKFFDAHSKKTNNDVVIGVTIQYTQVSSPILGIYIKIGNTVIDNASKIDETIDCFRKILKESLEEYDE